MPNYTETYKGRVKYDPTSHQWMFMDIDGSWVACDNKHWAEVHAKSVIADLERGGNTSAPDYHPPPALVESVPDDYEVLVVRLFKGKLPWWVYLGILANVVIACAFYLIGKHT